MIWTREYLVAAVAGTPDVDAAAGRLLRNQEDIGAAIAWYFSQAAGDKLTDLLMQHIMIAVDLVAAAKSGERNDTILAHAAVVNRLLYIGDQPIETGYVEAVGWRRKSKEKAWERA